VNAVTRALVILLGAVGLGGCAASSGRGPTEVDLVVADTDEAFREEIERLQAEQAEGGPVDWARVESTMRAIVKARPGFAEAWFNLGVARERRDRPEDAMEAYRRALAEDPTRSEAATNLARLAFRAGDGADAVRVLRRAVTQDPSAVEPRVSLASHHVLRGRFPEAEQLCMEALTYEPTHTGAYCVLARAAVLERRWGRVRLLAAAGFQIDPDLACLHEALGFAAEADGEPLGAARAFERAIALEPRRLRAHAELARLRMTARDYEGAVAALQKMTELDPENAGAWVNLGLSLKATGRFAQARDAYERALGLEPDHAVGHYDLGVLLLRQFDDLDGAESHLRRHLQLVAGEPDPRVFSMLEEIDARRQMVLDEPPAPGEPAAEEGETPEPGGEAPARDEVDAANGPRSRSGRLRTTPAGAVAALATGSRNHQGFRFASRWRIVRRW